MRVRIRRVPPIQQLEGVDLRPYAFREGRLYEVDPPVAQVLLSWGYAERHPKTDISRVTAKPPACSKCASRQTRITGQSEHPPLLHVHCGNCGYTSMHPLM